MVDQEIFLRRLEALRGYLHKVRAFQATDRTAFVRDEPVHDLAERYLHLMMECVLDLGNHYAADRDLGIPETNREVFDLLENAGELPAALADSLRKWAGFRNILVHDYLRIDHGLAWDAIQKDLQDIEAFYAWAVGKLPPDAYGVPPNAPGP